MGIDPTACPLLGERSIQLSYSAASRRGAMFEEESLLPSFQVVRVRGRVRVRVRVMATGR